LVTIALVLGAPGVAAAQTADPVPAGANAVIPAADPVPGEYIVTLRTPDANAVVPETIGATKRHGGQVQRVYSHALHGYSARMTPAQADALANDPSVASVEQDGYVHVDTTQAPTPSWGLDRIDQQTLPLNNSYTYAADGAGVHAYIIDTGILTSHQDFGGPGGRASVGVDEVGDGHNGIDCDGHGTHVAGTVGGSTYGVAKQVQLVAVRVLDCSGSGNFSDVIAGVDWVTGNAVEPAVANMSLGGPLNTALTTAVTNSIAAGIPYAVAAGNSNTSACNSSPASTPNAITVGATTKVDARASYSNFGTCLDLFAPGGDATTTNCPGVNCGGITSDWIGSDTATNTISGTSMATPHVTGVIASYLAANPCSTPAQVEQAIESHADPNVIAPGTIGSGSPNLLLNQQFIGADAPTVPCTAPVLAAAEGSGNPSLSWTIPNNGASPLTGYSILRSTTSGAEAPYDSVSPTMTTYSDAGALPGTTYFYKVVPTNVIGSGPASNEAPGPPTVPLSPAAVGSTGQVALSWSAPANNGGAPPVTYKVYRSTTTGFTPNDGTNLLASPSGTTYTDNAVTNGTTYYYRIVAHNPSGDSPPTAQLAATAGAQVQVVVRGGSNAMYSNRWNGASYVGFAPMPGVSAASPASTVFDGTRSIAFVRGADNALWSSVNTGAGWSTWTSAGGVIITDPTATTNSAGQVEVFVVGGDSALYVGRMNGGVFGGFTPLGGALSAPVGAAFDGTKYQVFVRGTDNAMYSGLFDPTSPGSFAFAPRGGVLTTGPSAAREGSTVRVFVRGGDLALYSASVPANSTSVSGFAMIGGMLSGQPAAVSEGGAVRVFWRGYSDNALWTYWVSGGSSAAPRSLGGLLTDDPGATSDGTTTRVFVVGGGGGLYAGSVPAGNGAFSGFTSLGGVITARPSASAGP
jgi:subtilisin family serine protease